MAKLPVIARWLFSLWLSTGLLLGQGIPEPVLSLLNAPSASVALTPGQTKAANWAARVVANGGADPTGSETVALATFWDGCITDGLDTLIIHLNHVSPNSKMAMRTPFIVGAGGNDPYTPVCGNNGTTTVDLTVDGVAASGGTSCVWNTGILDSTAFASDNDGGMVIYIFTTVSEASVDCGYGDDALANTFAFLSNAGNLKVANCRSQLSGGLAPTSANNQGYFSLDRTSSTSFNLYFANSGVAHTSLANTATTESGVRAAVSFYFLGNHQTDHGTGCSTTSTKRASFFAITKGKTSTQSSNFFSRIQTLRVALGGGSR
jgi:hypothetical protein